MVKKNLADMLKQRGGANKTADKKDTAAKTSDAPAKSLARMVESAAATPAKQKKPAAPKVKREKPEPQAVTTTVDVEPVIVEPVVTLAPVVVEPVKGAVLRITFLENSDHYEERLAGKEFFAMPVESEDASPVAAKGDVALFDKEWGGSVAEISWDNIYCAAAPGYKPSLKRVVYHRGDNMLYLRSVNLTGRTISVSLANRRAGDIILGVFAGVIKRGRI